MLAIEQGLVATEKQRGVGFDSNCRFGISMT